MGETPSQPTGNNRSSDAVASLSSIAGALAVVVYTVVATLRLLRSAGGDNPFGTIFFLILGAAILYFIVAIVVTGLAGLVIRASRWLQGSAPREGVSDTRSQEGRGSDEGENDREASRRIG